MKKLFERLKKVNKGTVIRSVTLILAIMNQIVAVIGASTFADAAWYQIFSVSVTAAASVVAAWENNDWTYFASLGTRVLDALADGKITADEVQRMLSSENGDWAT